MRGKKKHGRWRSEAHETVYCPGQKFLVSRLVTETEDNGAIELSLYWLLYLFTFLCFLPSLLIPLIYQHLRILTSDPFEAIH